MGKTPKTLAGLTPAAYNPKSITETNHDGLIHSMSEFGDISGIVFNLRTGSLVTGHQRVRGLQKKYGKLKIVNNSITTPEGEEFPVRFVDWDLTKEKAANITANNPAIQGLFTSSLGDLLDGLKLEAPEMYQALRFDELELLPQIDDMEYIGETEDISSFKRQSLNDHERAGGYLAGETKKFEFYLTREQYEPFYEKVCELKKQLKLETNTDVFYTVVMGYQVL